MSVSKLKSATSSGAARNDKARRAAGFESFVVNANALLLKVVAGAGFEPTTFGL